jgi:hypothetical protein
MIGKIIAIIHLSLAFCYSFYAFIFPSNILYDYYYFIFLTCVQMSWILCNHECPISYFYKYIHYKNYSCGDTTTLDDFKELADNANKNNVKSSIDYSKLGDTVFSFFLIMSIIIVGYRSKLVNMFLVIFIFIIVRYVYIFLNNAVGYNTKQILSSMLGKNSYNSLKRIYDDYQIIRIHDEINMLIAIILILFILYITYKNRKLFRK